MYFGGEMLLGDHLGVDGLVMIFLSQTVAGMDLLASPKDVDRSCQNFGLHKG
jgi:hypothetical protein